MPENIGDRVAQKIKTLHEIKRNFGDMLDYYITKQATERPDCAFWLDKTGQVVNSRIYKSVDISRDLFSKMRSNTKRNISKYIVCKIAFALRLDLEHARDLLHVAGYEFCDYDEFDVILKAFFEDGNYNVEELDSLLRKHGLPVFIGQK